MHLKNNKLWTCLIYLFLIKVTINDSCVYKEDGSGLLNTYHELYLNGNCYPCKVECKTCSSTQDSSCSLGNCQDNFYFDQSLSLCVKCASLCKTCSGPEEADCQVCLDGLYFNSVSKSCQTCPYGAKSCNGPTALSCYNRYFLDSQSFTCRKCPTNCYSCTSQSSCQQCEIGFFFVQSNLCKKCQASNCSKCYNSSACYECSNGYELILGQCILSNCTSTDCVKCPASKDICTVCAQGYFLFESKCYFGSSLLCLSGQQGSSYGKCASCRNGISYTNENNPSYCLAAQSQNRAFEYEFKSFTTFVACNTPYFMATEGFKEFSLEMVVKPIFQIDIEIRLISKLASSSIKVGFQDINGQKNFIRTKNSTRKQQGFFCKQKSLMPNAEEFLAHRIYESFYVNSLNQKIRVKISDITNSRQIFLSEIQIKKMLCLVVNCQACFTTGFCSSCVQGYLLEEYQCKLSCSEGYFTDIYHRQCVQQCQEGYYLVADEFKCQKCQAECLSCTGINICSKCDSGYFLFNHLCLNSCSQNTTYPDPNTNQCKKCQNPCKTCSITGFNCTSCLQGNLFNGNCIAECPFSYYSSFQSSVATCALCSSKCKSCSINSDYCTSCNSNLTLYNGKCLSACPLGFFQSQKLNTSSSSLTECKKCQSICSQCHGTSNNCTLCSVGFLFLISFNEYESMKENVLNLEIESVSKIFSLKQQMNAGTCLTKCPQLYFYEDPTNKWCIRCPLSCKKCQSSINCSKCESQYFLQTGACLSKCTQLTLYMNNKTNKCQKCKIPCETCQTDFSGIKCLTCVHGYYQFVLSSQNVTLNNVSCVVRCPVGYYKNDSVVKTCQSCPQTCSECLSLTDCTKCKSGYFLTDKNVCMLTLTCSDGYFIENLTNTCQRCHQSCKKCITSSYFCTECSNKNLLIVKDQGLCLSLCPSGYYQKTVYVIKQDLSIVEDKAEVQGRDFSQLSYCYNCRKECSACASEFYCTRCSEGYVLLNGSCVGDCPLSYYEDSDSQQGKICFPCQLTCNKCLSATQCLECVPPSILIQNQCLNSCFDGCYLNSTITSQNLTTYECALCPNQCQKCSSLTNCTYCRFNYFLYYDQTLKTSLCNLSCPSGFFKNLISRECDPCKSPCRTCLNGLVCLSCMNNLTLLNQNCIENCPDTFYFSQNTSKTISTCHQCISPCKKCKSAQQCTECQTGYFLNQVSFTCSVSCSDGFYASNLTTKCQKCQKPCKNCAANANNCMSCIEGFYFRNNFCLSVCPSGTFLENSGANYMCKNCPQTCKTCQSAKFCTQCKVEYFLSERIDLSNQNKDEQSCVLECSDTFYVSEMNRKCQKCHQTCETCIKDKLTCTSCRLGQVLLRNKCVQQCPSSYFLKQQSFVCEQCGKWCEKCQSKEKCTKCVSGYLFLGECLSECPSGYYENKEELLCSKCMVGCESCKNEFTCEKCSHALSYILYASECVQYECPDGLYLHVEQNECVENCPQLLNRVEQKCHEKNCPAYLIKSSGECVEKCRQNEFVRYLQGENAVQCQSLSYLQSKSINYEHLPQFKFEVIPGKSEVMVVLRFSFDAIKAKLLDEVLSDVKFSLTKSEQTNQPAYSQAQKTLIKNSEQRITVRKAKKRANAILVWLKISNFSETESSEFEQSWTLEAKIRNAYLTYFDTINNEKIPIQNYKQTLKFDLLNYSSQKQTYLDLSIAVWILMAVSIVVFLARCLLEKTISKLYIFASLLEFYQVMYFLTFTSVNLPPLMEGLFQAFRFTVGDLILESLLTHYSPWIESYQIMVSPWQFYKYTGDLHLFKNLSDVFIIFGCIMLLLLVSKLLNLLAKIGQRITAKILKKKIYILELFFWTFLPLITLYSIINIRFHSKSQQFQPQLQKTTGYTIFSYFLALSCFFSCLYFFYHQFMDKTMFDKGVNQQKKQLGVSIGLYRYLRKMLFAFFIAFYYDNSIHGICIFLLATSIIFIIVFWFQPYKNPLRQILSTVEEGSLIFLFGQILIFVLNPDYYAWISYIIAIHAVLHILLLLVYPTYWIFMFVILKKDIEFFENDPNADEITENFFDNQSKHQKNGENYVNEMKEGKINQASKINFAAIIIKKNQQNNDDETISANQADESDQGEVIKKKIINNVIRLAKKQTKKVKMFKNYDFSSDEEQATDEMEEKKDMNKKSRRQTNNNQELNS